MKIRIDGTRVLDESGLPLDMSGVGYGHVEIVRPQEDAAELKAMNARAGRVPWRWWGDYQQRPGFMLDSLSDSEYRHVSPSYTGMMVDVTSALEVRGIHVTLPMDSNYGQGMRGLAGSDFWDVTDPIAVRRRAQFVRLGKYAVRQIKPSTVEPIVEAMSPRASYQDVWNLQSTLMDAMLEGYSDVVFDIGGSPGYMPGYINNFYCAEWADRFPNKIRLIGNFLSDLIMDRIRCMDRLDRMESARDRWGVPVHVDQFCTNFAVDPDSSNLKWFCDQLKRRRISGMLWEWRTVWHTFGVYHLEDPNDPKSNSVIDQRRADVVREWLVA